MPCNTVRTVELKLKSVRMDLLRSAVESLGHRIVEQGPDYLIWQSGSYSRRTEAVSERSKEAANAIRQAYAVKLVETNLRRFGWQVRKQEQRI